ncbi:MAG: hypothetical protein WBA54_09975 [Acidaminobacteraceae bacterium]
MQDSNITIFFTKEDIPKEDIDDYAKIALDYGKFTIEKTNDNI